MKARLNELSKRDKKITIFGLVSIIGLILYLGVYSPLQNHVHTLRGQLDQDQKLLAWMRETDQAMNQIKPVNQNNKTASPIILLSALQKQVNEAGLGLALTQLKQGAGETIVLHFQKVEFDKLMRLLLTAIKQQNLIIVEMSAKSSVRGFADLEIVLEGSPFHY